jgi:hypothetical protein
VTFNVAGRFDVPLAIDDAGDRRRFERLAPPIGATVSAVRATPDDRVVYSGAPALASNAGGAR